MERKRRYLLAWEVVVLGLSQNLQNPGLKIEDVRDENYRVACFRYYLKICILNHTILPE